MRLLLDTHALVWALGFSSQLPKHLLSELKDPRNDLWCSSVNLIEIATKRSAGRRGAPQISAAEALQLSQDVGFRLLLVTAEHAIAVETLAISHPDPFDRLLLAQAQVEGLQLVTHDERLARYDTRTFLF
ncbi:MAG: type II toxin-antitoxin system VapC family toxin [Alphaproteobacteria bacterium]|nr:MAG: type II toxin-antitoxin system VapC family toxin [Alphaproteobacteria bacterium]